MRKQSRSAAGKPKKPATASEKTGGPVTTEKWVYGVIVRAARDRASDVHIEQTREGLSVRFRVDGVLRKIDMPPPESEAAVMERLKTMSRMDLDVKRVPQDGRYGAIIDGREVDFRVSAFPTLYGEALVMRVLDRAGPMPLDRVGFAAPALKLVRDLARRPRGVVLVAGPKGSGLTTVLYAMLNDLNREELNVMTLEDPVEYDLDGVRQSQMNPREGYTYLAGLQRILRQDPDVIMLGGIRDVESAGAAFGAALAGRRVFSSVHADDASAAITHLVDIGVEPLLVARGLEGVVAQRLVRVICPDCKESYKPDAATTRALGLKPGEKLYRGRGCAKCNQTGYQGRIGIFEVLPLTDDLRELVVTRPPWSAVQKLARQAGVATLADDGIAKARAGVTTVDEVVRVTGRL